MTLYPSTEIVKSSNSQAFAPKAKRGARVIGAVAISMGLIGAAGLPAYAVGPESTSNLTLDDFGAPEQSPEAAAQALRTAQAKEAASVDTTVDGAVSSEVVAREAAEAAARDAAAAAAKQAEIAKYMRDIPAGVGAQGIAAAALAQLGDFQDCTALVERSLRAIGIPAGDLGTQVYEYTNLGGTVVTSGDYAPGDILVWAGRHVAVYIGNGQAVHGGFDGLNTVIASAFVDGQPTGVVRF